MASASAAPAWTRTVTLPTGFSGKIFAQGTDVQVDYTHPGIGDSSRHQVDGRPVVIDPRITSAPPGGWDAYRVNQVIEASMRFNIEVEVEGGVSLGLYVGFNGDNWDAARRHARYIRGSGTDTLVFGYTVRPGRHGPKRRHDRFWKPWKRLLWGWKDQSQGN